MDEVSEHASMKQHYEYKNPNNPIGRLMLV